MKLILELLFTSTHSLPIFTSGQYLLHSKLHLEGLHYTSRFLPLHYLLAINDSNTRTCGGHWWLWRSICGAFVVKTEWQNPDQSLPLQSLFHSVRHQCRENVEWA